MQLLHEFLAVRLVEPELGLGVELRLLGLRRVFVNLAQAGQHVPAFLGKVLRHVPKLPPAVLGQLPSRLWNSLAGLRERASYIWMGAGRRRRGARATPRGSRPRAGGQSQTARVRQSTASNTSASKTSPSPVGPGLRRTVFTVWRGAAVSCRLGANRTALPYNLNTAEEQLALSRAALSSPGLAGESGELLQCAS